MGHDQRHTGRGFGVGDDQTRDTALGYGAEHEGRKNHAVDRKLSGERRGAGDLQETIDTRNLSADQAMLFSG